MPALLTPILSAERLRERWPGARPAVLWGFSALVLDLDYVRQRLLPELATRHFGAMRSNRPNTVDNQI